MDILMDRTICDRARLARDPRFDGLFFSGVTSTGIYCRPVCPAPPPLPKNIVYFPTAAAAAAAGLRPCLRCRPETAPGTPAWNGTSATVSRAMNLIHHGALDSGSVSDLAARLGMSPRHLGRLFNQHIGASPRSVANHQRLLFAKTLITETRMTITQVALAAGYPSLRRLHAAFRKNIGRTPSQLRKHPSGPDPAPDSAFMCSLILAYRPPYDWDRMLAFFRDRAVSGVEWADDTTYCRTVRIARTCGTIMIQHAQTGHALKLDVCLSDNRPLLAVVNRVRRMFDLDANPQAIHHTLNRDPLLAERIGSAPGLRLPGTWDPFETAIRAVVGQQISVKGAVTQLGRIVRIAAPPYHSDNDHALTRYFPNAAEIATMDMGAIGMPAKRKATLRHIAEHAVAQTLPQDTAEGLSAYIDAMTAVPGIGDWTANYIAMRAFGEPDAFPASDLGIIKALQEDTTRPTPGHIRSRADAWRPWRAYATIYLWHG